MFFGTLAWKSHQKPYVFEGRNAEVREGSLIWDRQTLKSREGSQIRANMNTSADPPDPPDPPEMGHGPQQATTRTRARCQDDGS